MVTRRVLSQFVAYKLLTVFLKAKFIVDWLKTGMGKSTLFLKSILVSSNFFQEKSWFNGHLLSTISTSWLVCPDELVFDRSGMQIGLILCWIWSAFGRILSPIGCAKWPEKTSNSAWSNGKLWLYFTKDRFFIAILVMAKKQKASIARAR